MDRFLNSFYQFLRKGVGCFLPALLLLLIISCNTPPDSEQAETAVPEPTASPTIQVEAINDNSSETSPENNAPEDASLEENSEKAANFQAVTIQKIGFSQVEDQIGYGVIFFNPNRDHYVKEVLFNIKLFDADNKLLQMHVEKLDYIAPEEASGVGGTIKLEEDQSAHHIEVQIDRQLETSLGAPLILRFFTLPQNITFNEETHSAVANGFVANATPDNSTETEIKGINNFRVTAIALDAAGNIIGGGEGLIGQTVRNGTVSPASATIPIITSNTPEKVEIYANQGHGGGLCAVTISRNSDFAHAECPLTTHTGG
ncbi:MAG: hypothetical protein KC449_26465 [Anaerolineales bacterium]|nr:hypothetical protein [Anaerolineales bacterium]